MKDYILKRASRLFVIESFSVMSLYQSSWIVLLIKLLDRQYYCRIKYDIPFFFLVKTLQIFHSFPSFHAMSATVVISVHLIFR